MKKFVKLPVLFCLFLVFLVISPVIAHSSDQPHQVNIYFFWGDGCPHCAAEKPFLESLVEKYPQVKLNAYEVYYNESNRELFKKFGDALNFEPRAVPTTIIGDQYWVGYIQEYQVEMEAAVQNCVSSPCEVDPGAIVFSESEQEKGQEKHG